MCECIIIYCAVFFFGFFFWGGGGVKISTFSWPSFVTWLKPVLNWANVYLPEHTSDTATNYDLFLN